jgi:peroxiredoxin
METNSELNTSRWVDSRMTQLRSRPEWQPDLARGLALFRKQTARVRERRHRRTWASAAVLVGCVLLWIFPPSRVLAQRCLSACRNLVLSAVHLVKRPAAAPDFVLKDDTGADVRLSAYRGKVVLLNFWATWCWPCRVEIPWFIEFESTYANRGLAVIGVSMDEDGWNSVAPYLAEMAVDYPVVIGNRDLATLFAVNALPMTLLIDREGKIATTHVGIVSKSDYENEIIRLLRE